MRRDGGGAKGDVGGGWNLRNRGCFYMRKKPGLGGWETDECDNTRVEARKAQKPNQSLMILFIMCRVLFIFNQVDRNEHWQLRHFLPVFR